MPHRPTPWQLGALLAVLLPFVYGYPIGPSPNMLPLFVGLLCAGVFIATSPQGYMRRSSALALLALPAVLRLHAAAVAPAAPSLLLGTALALLVFALVAQAAAGWQQQRLGAWLWGTVLLAALLNSAIALLQYQGWAAPFSPWLHPGNALRPFGNLRQPNQLATLCNMGFAVLIWYAPHIAPRWRSPRALWLGAALLLLAAACALSRSRTGLLQWALVWAAAVGWALLGRGMKTPSKQVALWACLGLLFYAAAQWWLAQGGHFLPQSDAPGSALHADASPLARLENASQDARTVLWANVLQVAAAQPWGGWGWGNLGWGMLNTPLQAPVFAVSLDNAHNLPLHLAAELGWPLALLFCAAVALWLWRRQPWCQTQPAPQVAWLVLLIIGLHSLLEYPLWHAPFLLAAALAFGVLAASPGVEPALALHRRWRMVLGWAIAALALVLALAWLRVVQIYLPEQQRWAVFTDQNDWPQRNAKSWWFAPYADFAQMGTIELSQDNAAQELRRAQRLLHYSSELRVLLRARDAAALLGDQALAQHYEQLMARRWPQRSKAALPPPSLSPSPSASGR